MRYFDYANCSKLEGVKRYFTKEEWEYFCVGLQSYDRILKIPPKKVKFWINSFDLENPVSFKKAIYCLFECCDLSDHNKLFKTVSKRLEKTDDQRTA